MDETVARLRLLGRLSCTCVVQATLSNPLNEKNLTSLEDLYNVSGIQTLRPTHRCLLDLVSACEFRHVHIPSGSLQPVSAYSCKPARAWAYLLGLQIVNSGDAYLNVHNVPNPMGVIRGQARSLNRCNVAPAIGNAMQYRCGSLFLTPVRDRADTAQR